MAAHSDDAPRETPTAASWSPAGRLGIRFLFCLAVLCLLTRLIITDAESYADLNPVTSQIGACWARSWVPLVTWFGKSVLGVHRPIEFEAGGNADGIYGHVQWLVIALLAAVSAGLWTLLPAKPDACERQLGWLRIALRYGLGFKMLSYGMVKVLGIQFTFPDLDILRAPYGEFRPMTVLWTAMGYSSTYTDFAAAVELLGGLLLFFRRTTTLGALISGGALVNVFMLDLSYDVPEKLDVLWMLGAALILVSPDVQRLNKVLLGRAVPAAAAGPARPQREVRCGVAARVLVIAWATIPITILAPTLRAEHAARSPLCGVYKVVEFTRDGKPVAPLTTDTEQWTEVVFTTPSSTTITLMDGSRHLLLTEVDRAGERLGLSSLDGTNKGQFGCSGAGTDQLSLRGSWKGVPVTAVLKKLDASTLPLVRSKRRWINGFP
jgi:hypothetical protein